MRAAAGRFRSRIGIALAALLVALALAGAWWWTGDEPSWAPGSDAPDRPKVARPIPSLAESVSQLQAADPVDRLAALRKTAALVGMREWGRGRWCRTMESVATHYSRFRIPLTAEDASILVPAVAERLGDDDAAVRQTAVRVLGFLGPHAEPAVLDLARMLVDPDEGVQRRAVWAIGEMGEYAREAAGALCRLIPSEDRMHDSSIVQALERLQTHDEYVLCAVAESAWLHGDSVGYCAVRILAGAGGPGARHLARLLDSPDGYLRMHAADALGEIGPPAREAIPALLETMARDDSWACRSCADAIVKMRPDVAEIVPRVLPLLDSEDRMVCGGAFVVLREGCSRRLTRGDLLRLLRDSSGNGMAWIVDELAAAGIDDSTAATLRALDVSEQSRTPAAVLRALRDRPADAVAFLRRYPVALSHMWWPELMSILKEDGARFRELKEEIRSSDFLPTSVMVRLGDSSYLPLMLERMRDADEHTLSYLRACARSLGHPADATQRISSSMPGTFRPASNGPGGDRRRMSADMHGHFDGESEVVVTGRILMSDGSIADYPDVRIGWFLLSYEPRLFRHDPATGRFTCIVTVFAAYADGDGDRTPGPYGTGSRRLRFTARKAKALYVTVYDEMPDTEIVLDPTEPVVADE